MSRDPFHRQILQALSEKRFDPLVFESCMCDLLRDPFPGLVPIPGGRDAGCDGAIADGKEEPYPLVCTTAEDVSRNLRDSLDAYKRNGGRQRRVVLATSQALTPRKRQNLEERARDLEFTLVQVFAREAIADRLYRDPDWCMKLLSLSGDPPALSKVPPTPRSLPEIELIGRAADVEWLRTTTGDRLLYGEPGSGKTYLLRHLVRDGWGLFLHDADDTRVAGALREQEPEIVVVDDAHRGDDRIELLMRLRAELGRRFSIVAATWEGDRDRLVNELSLETSKVHRLELLSRRDILEVIRQEGIHGPLELLSVLADQAMNKPGLAVTLASLCLRGDWREVVEGEALRTTLMPFFEDLVGRQATDLLAALALGGVRGMGLEAVGEFLGLGRAEVRRLAIGLAAGGVLSEVGRDRDVLAAQPRDLRSALLRRTFFQGSHTDLPFRPLLAKAPDVDSAAQAMLDAAARGARVPIGELREIVQRSGFSVQGTLWKSLAILNETEATWVMDHYPGKVSDIALELLKRIPQQAIPKLLAEAAESPDAPLHALPSHPLRILQDWLDEASSHQEILKRRWLVLEQVEVFVRAGGDRRVAVNAAFSTLNPRWQRWVSSPDRPGMVDQAACLRLETLREMPGLWEKVRGFLEEVDLLIWTHIGGMVSEWIRQISRLSGEHHGDYREAMRAFPARVLNDLVPFAETRPGIAAELLRWASALNLELPISFDPDFSHLYPKGWEMMGQTETKSAILAIAEDWSRQPPQEVAARLAGYEREADWIRPKGSPFAAQLLSETLAQKVREPASWLDAFLDHALRSELVRPWIEAVGNGKPAGWEESIAKCLAAEDADAGEAVAVILRMPDPPPDLLAQAVSILGRYLHLVQSQCLLGEVPEGTLRILLQHPDPAVAVAAAVGEWARSPGEDVRDGVREPWRQAILRSPEIEPGVGTLYWLEEILGHDPSLEELRPFVSRQDTHP